MIDLKLMIKFITLSFLILLQLFGVVEPAFAAIPPGAQKSTYVQTTKHKLNTLFKTHAMQLEWFLIMGKFITLVHLARNFGLMC